jgi:autophagy-related protein 101
MVPRVIVCNTFPRQPGVSDTAMEQLVSDKVEAFRRGIETQSGYNKRGQVDLRDFLLQSSITNGTHCQQINVFFSEKRPKKSWFPVYMGEEEVPWEKW